MSVRNSRMGKKITSKIVCIRSSPRPWIFSNTELFIIPSASWEISQWHSKPLVSAPRDAGPLTFQRRKLEFPSAHVREFKLLQKGPRYPFAMVRSRRTAVQLRILSTVYARTPSRDCEPDDRQSDRDSKASARSLSWKVAGIELSSCVHDPAAVSSGGAVWSIALCDRGNPV